HQNASRSPVHRRPSHPPNRLLPAAHPHLSGVLVAFLLCAFKGSLQSLLDDLFATLQAPLPRTVTQSALSQARQKLKASVFEALNERLLGSLAALATRAPLARLAPGRRRFHHLTLTGL